MKKILLAAGGQYGLLKVLPLCKVLREHKGYDVVFAAGSPLPKGERNGEDLPELFGISGDIFPVETTGTSPVGQTASAMSAFEMLLLGRQPDLVIVGGDDDVALSAALSASKLGLPVASVGAGLRDYNRSSSSEISRKLIDAVSDILFVSEHSGEYNLINEGYDEERMFFVGEMAIDSLAGVIGRANDSTVTGDLGIEAKKYVLLLLDRAAALDNIDALKKMECLVKTVAERQPVIMLVDPDVEAVLREHEMEPSFVSLPGVQVVRFPGYVELLRLVKDALFILTDSVTAQTESTVMKVPCLTMLDDTPSPATIEIGTNVLVGDREEDILQGVDKALDGKIGNRAKIPEKWDGAVAQRIMGVLDKVL